MSPLVECMCWKSSSKKNQLSCGLNLRQMTVTCKESLVPLSADLMMPQVLCEVFQWKHESIFSPVSECRTKWICSLWWSTTLLLFLMILDTPLSFVNRTQAIQGDVCGDFTGTLSIFENGGLPPQAKYLFLGNYVCRGKQSLETICLLLAYKIKFPGSIFLLRGSGESSDMIHQCGFSDECDRRYRPGLGEIFTNCFNCLPVAALISQKIFCIHGGLSPDLQSLDQIRNLQRPIDVPYTGLLCDLLWSDPGKDVKGWVMDNRVVSYTFGPDKVTEFLQMHDLDLICRAHQVVEDGYEFFADKQLVTIFSAPDNSEEYYSTGAIMNVDKNIEYSFQLLMPFAKLPDELLTEMILRLPDAEMARYASVAKKWKVAVSMIIKENSLMLAHLNTCPRRILFGVWLSIQPHFLFRGPPDVVVSLDGNPCQNLEMFNACFSDILFGSKLSRGNIALYNPCTSNVRRLASHTRGPSIDLVYVFDDDDFFILRIFKEREHYKFEVLKLSTGTWGSEYQFLFDTILAHSVVLGPYVYYQTKCGLSDSVLKIRPRTLSISYTPIPRYLCNSHLCEVMGGLGLCSLLEPSMVRLCKFANEGWSVLFHIDLTSYWDIPMVSTKVWSMGHIIILFGCKGLLLEINALTMDCMRSEFPKALKIRPIGVHCCRFLVGVGAKEEKQEEK